MPGQYISLKVTKTYARLTSLVMLALSHPCLKKPVGSKVFG